ncbi:MAG: methionyl-tRNA formyltransferase [Clostridiales bacterium]|nr:methionyl-tRNA formyltransferase [Clostridiales bacterium]
MRVIFLGTPEFSVRVLQGIVQSNHEVMAVVTQPDRKNARGNKINFSKVKEYALGLDVPILQYENISLQGQDELKKLNADIMVTAAYGQILKQNILDICPKGIINVHASLLPKYRGASPVQWALLEGQERVGVTIMQTELGVDTGDIILQKEIALDGYENTYETLQKLSVLGAEAVVEALDLIEQGNAIFTPQIESQATYCRMLKKEDGKIDWAKSSKELKNFIRGMTPWPSAFTTCKFGKLKILRANALECENTGIVGEIMVAEPKKGLIVSCGQGCLDVLTVQGENAKAMDIKSFLLGKRLQAGEILGD